VNEPLPLAAAGARLRGRPGRPRKARPPAPSPAPISERRLLDLDATATYLGVSAWVVRDLESAGTLQRVRIPFPTAKSGELRKLLFDREDLDRLIASWKEPSA
jgi:hypothetical protein